MRLANFVFLEAEDANECNVGDVFILLMWGVCEITHVEKDAKTGKVLSLKCIRKPEASVKKIKKKFNFVAETKDIYKAKILEFDHLITKPKLEEVCQKKVSFSFHLYFFNFIIFCYKAILYILINSL